MLKIEFVINAIVTVILIAWQIVGRIVVHLMVMNIAKDVDAIKIIMKDVITNMLRTKNSN